MYVRTRMSTRSNKAPTDGAQRLERVSKQRQLLTNSTSAQPTLKAETPILGLPTDSGKRVENPRIHRNPPKENYRPQRRLSRR